jgi:signal peptidase II
MRLLQFSRKHIPWLVVLLVLFIDQTTKIIVKTQMTLGQNIPVIGNWFNIYFIENEGMAFGMQFSGEYGKLILSIFRIIAVIFIGWYIHKLVLQKAHRGLIMSVSLIMAGAIGNITDSAFYGLLFSESYFSQTAEFLPEGGGYASFLHGRVVDMLYFPLIRGNFPGWFPFWGGQEFIFFRPVFNVADSAITIGVFILLIFQKKFFDSVKKPESLNVAA